MPYPLSHVVFLVSPEAPRLKIRRLIVATIVIEARDSRDDPVTTLAPPSARLANHPHKRKEPVNSGLSAYVTANEA